jgi:hypothetical protein
MDGGMGWEEMMDWVAMGNATEEALRIMFDGLPDSWNHEVGENMGEYC